MKPSKISVFYNKDFGYIIASETKIVGSIINTVVNPVITLNSQSSNEELGREIISGLKKSEEAKPINSLNEGFKFWQISGMKSFRTFSQKFQNIKITRNEKNYLINKMKTLDKGGYIKDENNSSYLYPLTLSASSLGSHLLKLIDLEEKIYTNEYTFNTIHSNKIIYDRPSDVFEDKGDGHTDAYQIFTLNNDDNTFIAFIIDNGYKSFNVNDIRTKWTQWYPELYDFTYQRVNENGIEFIVTANVQNMNVTSYFYNDDESYLEIMTQSTKNSKEKKEIENVINSIKIEKFR